MSTPETDFTPAARDFAVTAGDCLPLSFQLLDGSGNGIALTGYGVLFALLWDGGTLQLSTGNGRLSVVEGEDGAVISGEIASAESAALPPGRRTTYRLTLTEPDGCIRTVLGGYVRITT